MQIREILTIDPRGTSGRAEFLAAFVVFCFVVGTMFMCSRRFGEIGLAVFGLWMLILEIRRLNDMDWSGWWAATIILPQLNFILILFLIFTPGKVRDAAQ